MTRQITCIEDQLRLDEGERLTAYQDHLGYWTIGVGRLIDDRKGGGISPAESTMLLRHDIERVEQAIDKAIKAERERIGRALRNVKDKTTAIDDSFTVVLRLWAEFEQEAANEK